MSIIIHTNLTLQCISLKYISLLESLYIYISFFVKGWITLHCVRLLYITCTWHMIILHRCYITSNHTTSPYMNIRLHHITPHSIALHEHWHCNVFIHITLLKHYITSHHITLQYISLHYIDGCWTYIAYMTYMTTYNNKS